MSLKRAFRNLIDNAIKYAGSVEVDLRVDANKVAISVNDGGPGIPEDRIEEAFAPFRRLDTARSGTIPGAGLGLTIARDVIQSHGGTLAVRNRAGGGLAVSVSLPRR